MQIVRTPDGLAPSTTAPAHGSPRWRVADALYNRARTVAAGVWPASWAWRGAALGASCTAIVLAVIMAAAANSGVGVGVDALVGLGVGLAGIALLGTIILVVVTVVRRVPTLTIAAVLASMLVLMVLPLIAGVGPPLVLVALIVIPLEALAGASIGAAASGAVRNGSVLRRTVTVTLLVLALAANVYGVTWLASSGHDEYLVADTAPTQNALTEPNPSDRGPFDVKTLTYGSGTDRQRPEYGAAAALRTSTVDASPLLPALNGMKARLRQWYWGFDATAFPINGRVWYPVGAGPFPLVLIVHGNRQMEQHSDQGYAYLGDLLASRGFITVSVDENFLNNTWSGDLGGAELQARAWILLQHLATWRSWNGSEGHQFHARVDMQHIALIGHSRGGEAAAVAAVFNRLPAYPEDATVKFDFNFAIESVVALSPTVDTYRPVSQPLRLDDINYLVLHGGHDGDIVVFAGSRQYSQVAVADADHFKAALWIHRANHSQFNTIWGNNDWGGPLGRMLNTKPLLAGDEQRQIAKVFVSGFLEATLHGQRAYVPMFRDWRRAAAWLPDTIYINRFQDARFRVVSNYEEDVDVSTTTIAGGSATGTGLQTWREQRLLYRLPVDEVGQANTVVGLGWDARADGVSGSTAPAYILTVPPAVAEWRLDADWRLAMSIARGAVASRAPVDFTIELADAHGTTADVPLSRVHALDALPAIWFSKLSGIESALLRPSESALQSYELPLTAFVTASPALRLGDIRTITLRFDRTLIGDIVVDDIGFVRD